MLRRYTQTGEKALENTPKMTDDFGEPWYSYDDESIPINKPFNQRRLDGGMTSHIIKTGESLFYEYIEFGDPKEKFNRSIGSTGMPQEYMYKSSKDFKTDIYEEVDLGREALIKARNYIKEYKQFAHKGKGLYIYSPSTGSGKTFLSCLVANGLIKMHDQSVRFVKSSILLEELKKELSGNKDSSPTNDKLKMLQQAQVLIIDDFATEKVTDFASAKMYELISKRSDLHKVTIITSRKTLDKLKYNAPTVAAIGRSCIPILLPDEDIGTKIAYEANKELEKILTKV